MTDPTRAIHNHIQDALARVSAAREQACEAALQTGKCGVLEIRFSDGSYVFDVTESVPYGEIYVWDRRAVNDESPGH